MFEVALVRCAGMEVGGRASAFRPSPALFCRAQGNTLTADGAPYRDAGSLTFSQS